MAREIVLNTDGLGNLAADADRAALAFYRLAQSQEMAAAASRTAAHAKAQLSSALGNLQSSLTQAFLPVYQVALPALSALLNGIAGVIALLTGRGFKATDGAAKAYQAVASGARKAASANSAYKKSLAGFDTLDTLQAPSGSAGGGFSSGGLAAVMEESQELPGWLLRLMELLEQVKAIFAPFLETVQTALSQLWQEHLAPLWESLCQLFSQLRVTLLDIWNGILMPILQWMVATFGPAIGQVISFLLGSIGSISGFVADVVRGVTQFLTNLLQFVSVFAQSFGVIWSGIGEHLKEVWHGIWEFIRGIVNGIVGLVNGMLSAIVAGLNAVIGALNSFSLEVPEWVPGYGGRRLGFTISQLSAPVIPHLATGAVIPPNNPYLAVVGDQRSGTNIETPLETMIEAFQAAQASQPVNIRFTGDLAQLGRVLKPVLERESRRVGGSLITGGAI